MSAELALPRVTIDVAKTDPNNLIALNQPLSVLGADARCLIIQLALLRDGAVTPKSIVAAMQEAAPYTELDVPTVARKLKSPLTSMVNSPRWYVQRRSVDRSYIGTDATDRLLPVVGLQAARRLLRPEETAQFYPSNNNQDRRVYGHRLAVLQALLEPRPSWKLFSMLKLVDDPTTNDDACRVIRRSLVQDGLVVPTPGQPSRYQLHHDWQKPVEQVVGEFQSLADRGFADEQRMVAYTIAHDSEHFGTLARVALAQLG